MTVTLIRLSLGSLFSSALSINAVSHPAVPPPTIVTRVMRLLMGPTFDERSSVTDWSPSVVTELIRHRTKQAEDLLQLGICQTQIPTSVCARMAAPSHH